MSKLILALGFVALLAGTAFFMQSSPMMNLQASSGMMTQEHVNEFSEWKRAHARSYSDADLETYRIRVFMSNKAYIEETNNQNLGFTLGPNQFMDITKEEFIETHLGLIGSAQKKTSTYVPATNAASIDWVAKGKVSDVKNQGSCGSCWAFAAVAALESAVLQQGKTGTFSEQQLVDCSRLQGNMGCSGGLMDAAYRYVKKGGLTTDGAYPYMAKNQLCKFNGGDLKIDGMQNPAASDCGALADALQNQPIAVAVDASNWSFYKSGAFSNCQDQLNHGVLLTGYNSGSGEWHIKNSWGNTWGDKGYITLAGGDTCGVCDDAVYPTGVKV